MNRREVLVGCASVVVAAKMPALAAEPVVPLLPTFRRYRGCDWPYITRSALIYYGNPDVAPVQFSGFEQFVECNA